MRYLILSLFLSTLFFCRPSPEEPLPMQPGPFAQRVDILALGDSYTIGTVTLAGCKNGVEAIELSCAHASTQHTRPL